MKKWRKQIGVLAGMVFAVFLSLCSVQANPLQPYDISQAVAPEELERKSKAANVGDADEEQAR